MLWCSKRGHRISGKSKGNYSDHREELGLWAAERLQLSLDSVKAVRPTAAEWTRERWTEGWERMAWGART